MLYHLDANDFARARPLFDDRHLAVISALAGESPAELYVDDPASPRAALLALWNERFFLAGEPGDGPFARGVAAWLNGRYRERARENPEFYRVIMYDLPAWERYLPTLFADVRSFRAEREYYRLRLTAEVDAPALPPGFRVRPVDAALMADDALGNIALVRDESQSEAPSVEAFLASRFGSCIEREGDLVAWCLSEYNHGDRCELGIETLETYQRQGLGLAVARATITQAHRAGITTVGWHCWKRNLPSSALARKLGFTLVETSPVWVCQFGQGPERG